MSQHGTRLRAPESHRCNSTGVDKPGDEELAAFDVTLEVVRCGAAESDVVTVAGLDAGDAARRARWQMSRDTGVPANDIRVIGSMPAASRRRAS